MKAGIITVVATLIIIVGGVMLASQPPADNPDNPIVSESGLHWHPRLEIYVNGEAQEVPSDIGIGAEYAASPTYSPRMQMTSVHTHEPNGVIHFEFDGVVRESDITLSTFFEIWGEEFSQENFMGHEIDENDLFSVTVNGEEVDDIDNIILGDNDQVVIRFEEDGKAVTNSEE